MNETIRTLLSRRSIRSYTDQIVPRELLDQIVECGKFAATAMGRQPWHFTVVTSRAALDEIVSRNREILLADGREVEPDFDNFRGAPCAILVSGDESNEMFADIDCANATENMAIAACSLGLGSCYIASFRPAFNQDADRSLHRRFGIPDGYRATLALAVGYADGEPSPRAERLSGTVNYVE